MAVLTSADQGNHAFGLAPSFDAKNRKLIERLIGKGEIAKVDWIRVTGRWQLSSKTPQRGKNSTAGKHKSAEERDVSRRAVAEENEASEEVKKPFGR